MMLFYYVNFNENIIFDGHTTKFLRISIPPHDNHIQQPSNEPSPRSYYITLLPVYLYDDNSQYYINNINVIDIYNDLNNGNIVEYNSFNFFGTSNNKLFFGDNYDKIKLPKPNYWDVIHEGDIYEYRIDYDGNDNEIIKLVLFISEFKPIYNNTTPSVYKFIHGYDAWANNGSELLDMPPIPLNSNIVYTSDDLKKGIKSINSKIYDYLLNNNISESQPAYPYYEFPYLPFKIDYKEIDIIGFKNTQRGKKII